MGKKAGLDRFGTHRTLVEWLPELKERTGGDAAGLLALVLWDMANGRTGEVKNASVSNLARKTAMSRNTVRPALKALLKAGIISTGKGSGRYMMHHRTKGEKQPGSVQPCTEQ